MMEYRRLRQFSLSLPGLLLTGAVSVLSESTALAQGWIFLDGPANAGRMSAFDQLRQRLVALGADGATWELAGGELLQRQVPGVSPPPRGRGALVYDRAREHVLLFGGFDAGGTVLNDTWFWDGVTWLQQLGGAQPAARVSPGIGYDMVRQRVVLYGGQQLPGQLADTWEHDGTQWLQRTPATQPGPNSPLMAYDLASLRMVMVTHSGFVNMPVTTWEWDGVDWAQRATNGPPSNGNEGLAYDPVRHRVVMYGGVGIQGEIWEWNGVVWQQHVAPNAPWRLDPAVYFDTATQRIAVFGGTDFQVSGFSTMSGSGRTDAYSWDGSTWSSVHNDLRPGSRYGHILCEQPGGGVVLFGGTYQQAQGDDTWVWRGNGWRAQNPAHRPQARSAAGAAFDSTRQEALLFGGAASGTYLSDLWAWNGQDWALRDGGSGPAGRVEIALSYDVGRGVLVLFGGFSTGGNRRGDTWEWNGTVWTQRAPALSPSPRAGAALAYDPVRQRTVLFGGRIGFTAQDQLADTWEWDGTNWQQLSPSVSPPALLEPSMQFDPATGGLQLVGTHVVGSVFSTQVWQLLNGAWTQLAAQNDYLLGSPTAWDAQRQRIVGDKTGVLSEWAATPAAATPFGAGCGAPAPTIGVRTRSRLGAGGFGFESASGGLQPMMLAVGFGQGNAPIGGACSILITSPLVTLAALTDASGRAEVGLPLPAAMLLRGVPLYAQAAGLDSAMPLGVGLSPGLAIFLGD
jgi:hypothetical protein